MGHVWRWVMEPMLFVTVGSTLDFATISGGTIPKALIIVFTGVILRMITTYLTMAGFGYSWKEKLFYGIAWTPKATVQAALSAAPLTLIKNFKAGAPDYDQWLAWGNDILTTGLFAIIICGTLGVLAIHFAAPVLLKPAVEDEDEEEEGTTTEEEEGEGREERPGSGGRGSDLGGAEDGVGGYATTGAAIGQDNRSGLPVTSSGLHPHALLNQKPPLTGGVASTYDRVPSQQRIRRIGSELQVVRSTIPPFEGLVAGEDFSLVADYIDSIQHLTTAVNAGEQAYSRDDVLRLSQRVLDMQHRIESEIGHREPSVRELFRTASVMRYRRSGSALGLSRSGAASRSIGSNLERGRSRGRSFDASHSSRTKNADDFV
jgi:hypothetical protein